MLDLGKELYKNKYITFLILFNNICYNYVILFKYIKYIKFEFNIKIIVYQLT